MTFEGEKVQGDWRTAVIVRLYKGKGERTDREGERETDRERERERQIEREQ